MSVEKVGNLAKHVLSRISYHRFQLNRDSGQESEVQLAHIFFLILPFFSGLLGGLARIPSTLLIHRVCYSFLLACFSLTIVSVVRYGDPTQALFHIGTKTLSPTQLTMVLSVLSSICLLVMQVVLRTPRVKVAVMQEQARETSIDRMTPEDASMPPISPTTTTTLRRVKHGVLILCLAAYLLLIIAVFATEIFLIDEGNPQ